MKRPNSKRMKGMQKQLRTQPEKPIDNDSSSEDNNIEKTSTVVARKEAHYMLLEDVEPSTESVEEGAAHSSTQKTVSLASNESSSEDSNVEKLSDIESEEEGTYDIEEDLELSSESEEEWAAHLSTQRTESLASRFIYGVDKCFEWSVTPPTEKKQTEADEEWNYEPEVLSDAKDKETPIEVWSLLFTDEMLSKIVEYTNVELSRKREDNESNRSLGDINLKELKALIGILCLSGLQGNSDNLPELWKSSNVFCANMSRTRFKYLVSLLQFDDESTLQERCQIDRLAPIRDLWDLFISNCTKYYSPGKNVTIGEQLVTFKGKCSFLVKMGLRQGLRIVMMNDSNTYYMINAIPHLGKNDNESQKSMSSYYVRKLLEPIYHSHRNITCNKRFTSVPLVQRMKNEYLLSMVGTIQGKEKEIPQKMKKFTEINDSRFLYADNVTLLSHCPKQSKIILVLSSLHEHRVAVVEKKLQIIEFYNSTKGGTDSFDHLYRQYSILRRSHRWTIKFFYAMLNQSLANSYILYNLNKEDDAKVTKLKFLKTLARQLYIPHIKSRLLHGKKGLSKKLREIMEDIVKRESSE